MVSDEIRHANQLRRRSRVPPEHRTPDRSEVADWIEEHAADNWQQWSASDIADEVGYSRQHVNNVLEHYFVPVEEQDIFEEVAERLGVQNMDRRDELVGELTSRELLIYRLGYQDAVADTQAQDRG